MVESHFPHALQRRKTFAVTAGPSAPRYARSAGAKPLFGAQGDKVLAAVILLGLYGSILGLTLWLIEDHAGTEATVVPYAVAVFVTALIGLTVSVFTNRGVVDLLVWFFLTFSLAWPGLLQVLTWQLPWGPRPGPDAFKIASWILILFMVAYFLAGQIKTKRTVRSSTIITYSSYTQAFLLLCLALGIFGILSVGLSNVLGSGRGAVNEMMDEKSKFYPYLIGKEFALAGLLVGLSALRNASKRITRLRILAILIPLALTTLLIFNPNTNPRAQTLAIGLAVIILYYPNLRAWQKAAMASGLAAASFFGLGALKEISTGVVSATGVSAFDNLKLSLFRCDYDTFQQTAAAVDFVSRHDFRWGVNILGAVLFFVPRPLWPSKPVDSGNLVAGDLGYIYTNVSCPLPAEFYLAFGMVGVVVMALVLGYYVRRSTDALQGFGKVRSLTFEHCLYALYGAYVIILLRGSLSAILPLIGFAFVALYLWPLFKLVFERRDQKKRTRRA